MTDMLPNRLVEALFELKRYEDRGATYWWRQSSMGVLAQKGYVYPWHPKGKRVRVMAYSMTDRGHEFLKGFPPATSKTEEPQ